MSDNVSAFVSTAPSSSSELSVIGSIITYGSNVLHDIHTFLYPFHFSDKGLATVYKTCLELYKDGKDVDIVTVDSQLITDSTYPGLELLTSSAELANRGLVNQHAKIIIEEYTKRELSMRLNMINTSITRGSSLDTIYNDISKLGKDILTISDEQDLESIGDVAKRVLESTTPRGVPTGYGFLDKYYLTFGGLPRGHVTVVAADSGDGKSALGAGIELNTALEYGSSCLDCTLEDEPEVRIKRWLSGQLKVNNTLIQRGDWKQHKDRILSCVENWRDLPIRFLKREPRDIYHLCSIIQRAHYQKPLDFVLIDYLQLIPSSGYGSDQEKTDEIMSEIVKLSRRMRNTAFMLVSQFRKRYEFRPSLDDLYHSNSIRQKAHTVLLLWGPRFESDTGERIAPPFKTLIIAKQKNGIADDVVLGWDRETVSFYQPDSYQAKDYYSMLLQEEDKRRRRRR